MPNTLEYYNEHAEVFYKRTINSDVSEGYVAFEAALPSCASILDAGCCVGRDIKHFLKQGYRVTAFDASEKMVQLAEKETGIAVQKMTFQEMPFENSFDGVWAQASLLHVPYEETRSVYQNIHRALKPQGVFFAAYKYGESSMESAERAFWNMTESSILPYLDGLFEPIKIWVAKDTRFKVCPQDINGWTYCLARKV